MICSNAGEKGISTFKDHFKAILAGVEKTFPMHLWDCLLLQTESTLNMLCPMKITPTISVYAYMYGQHDYKKVPLAPMGCSVMVHDKMDTRRTWDDHAINGYYLESLREHF